MRTHSFYILLLALLALTSCRRVTLSIEKVPTNTPKGAQIYVAGSFNNWNPGDPNYLMMWDEETQTYSVNLPLGFGNVAYKFTRGDWTTVETDACGGELLNRTLSYSDAELEMDSIVGWKDLEPENCERITLIIQSLPENTPKGSVFYLGGDANGWQCNNDRYRFTFTKDSLLMLTLPRNADKLVYKITRGTWESAELNDAGTEQLQRELQFGKQDTVYISIHAWMDLPMEQRFTQTIVVQSQPKGIQGPLFLAGSFNNWNPVDGRYQFNKLPDGRSFITVSHAGKEKLVYKVTRGGWQTVETNRNFKDISNRELPKGRDTVYIKIEAWADMAPGVERKSPPIMVPQSPPVPAKPSAQTPVGNAAETAPENLDSRRRVFIILNKVPEYRKNETVYLAGDINGWDDRDPNYAFRNLPNGKKFLLLRLSDNERHEFKLTRGNWNNEEANLRKEKLDNRVIRQGAADDTIYINVQAWYDEMVEKPMVMVLTATPENTPPNEPLYLTGDFNDWLANDEKYKFKRLADGRYVLTIADFSKRYGFYKITRGSWETEATTRTGRIPGNQQFKQYSNDTIKVRIESWKDR